MTIPELLCQEQAHFSGRWPLRDDHDRSMVRWLWLVENQTSWGSFKKTSIMTCTLQLHRYFFQFHSWIFFTRAPKKHLKTPKKSSTKRSIYSSLSLVLSPYQPLRSWIPASGGEVWFRWAPQMGQNSLEGIILRWRTWCWRKNGPNILQIVQVLSLFCWELRKWCVRKWCVYSIHTYCKYHICDMCIATAALVQPSLVW